MDWRIFKPKSYQIRWLDSTDSAALLSAGIPTDSTAAAEGVFILAEDLPRVLAALNADVAATFPSPYKRIDEVVLSRKDAGRDAGAVSIAYGADQAPSAEAESLKIVISRELMPFVKRDIVVHLAKGSVSDVIRDGRFHIFIDSAAADAGTVKLPEVIFDVPVSMKSGLFTRTTHVAYKATRRGYAIVDKQQSFTVAELVDDCLFVHFNLLNVHPQSLQSGLFARILRKVADQLRADELVLEVLASLGVVDTKDRAAVSYVKNAPSRFARQTLILISGVLAGHVKKPVQVHVGAGAQAALNDDSFHVYLPGTPVKTDGTNVPAKVFGLPVTAGKRAWKLAAGSAPVFDGDFAAAQLVGMDNCYLNFDPLSDGDEGLGNIKAEWELLGRLLQEALKELDVDAIVRQIVSEVKEPAFQLAALVGQPTPSRIEIGVQGFSGRSLAVVTALVEQVLVPVVRKDVMVWNAWGEHRHLEKDGRFHVFVQSSPMGLRCVTPPSAVYGISLSSSDATFWPSGAGIALADDAGFLYGELAGDNLYLHTQVVSLGTRNESRLLARMFMAALQEYVQRLQEDYATTLGEAFVAECSTRVKARIENTVHNPFDPEHAKKSGAALQEAIALTHRNEAALLRIEVNEQFGREYDELLAIDKVRDVTVGGGKIVVETKTLFCRDPRTGHIHDIGAFKIEIPTEGGRLRWYNQTRLVQIGDRKMNAPHVAADGHACEGTTKAEWPQFIADRQFAYVVMKAIQFVESVNTDDAWGKGINNWPVASAR